MGFFDKKKCSICGGDAGRVFVKKLEDGLLCKECTGKLSPWFTGRRHSSVAEIEEQLAYREANKAAVAVFSPTRTWGGNTKVYLDEAAGKFIVTKSSNWRDENPDVIAVSDVLGVQMEAEEHRWEEKYRDSEGKEVSYNPPRFRGEVDYYVEISVNTTYFDEIRFKLNDRTISDVDFATREATVRIADDLKATLMGNREAVLDAAAAAAAPKMAAQCKTCGATTTPTATGCCEYCGCPL
ncbi:MAG: DUF4428 domain-containing protein [Coriobacteriia bacterium]|nr:DUF4428 domain-containing protein [Coriobacteriia bacterium]